METLICRILMITGVLVGVLLAGGHGMQAAVPALLVLIGVGVLRQVAPSLPWRLDNGRRYRYRVN